MKVNFRDKNGFTTVDLSIAMIVLIIFVVIMTSFSNNVYLASMEAKRTAVALNYAVDIFEHIGRVSFDEVVASTELLAIPSLQSFKFSENTTKDGVGYIKGKIGTYNISLEIKDEYGDGIVKTITLTIEYPVSRKTSEKLELKRLKTIDPSTG